MPNPRLTALQCLLIAVVLPGSPVFAADGRAASHAAPTADTGSRARDDALVRAPAQPMAAPAHSTAGQPDASAGQGVTSLTLAAALAMAQNRSFVLRQFDARVTGAAARLTAAGAVMNPALIVAGHAGHDAAGTDEDYVLSQTFELGDKRRQRVRAARAERDASGYDRAGSLNDLAFSVRSAYYEAQRADAARQLAQTARENARKFAQAAELQFAAGDVPRTQVMRSNIEQNRAEQALAAAETERANRFATLRSLIHLGDAADFSLADPLSFTQISYTLSALQAYALTHRPDLMAAQVLKSGKEAQLHGARAQSQPDLFVEARHANIDPAQGGDTIRIGVLFPLLDFGKNRAEAASAKAAVMEQEAVLAETRRTAVLEVENAYRTLLQAKQSVEAFRNGRLDSSKELLDLAQLGYSRGATSFLELLDAQQVYRNEQADYTRALADYNVAVAGLQHALGGQLP